MTIDRAYDAYDDDHARMRWLDWQNTLCRRWYGFAWKVTAPRSGEVDDLVQEVVARALHQHLTQPFPSMDDAARWGVTVLAHLVKDQQRHDRRHAGVSLDDLSEMAADPRHQPHEIAENRELVRLVRNAVDCLRPADRAAIRARFHDGLTYSEAGALLGIGESAFGVRLHRALHRLRAHLLRLARHGPALPGAAGRPGRPPPAM